jgi:flagellin
MPEKNFTEDYTMALTINTNIMSLNAQRNLSTTQNALSTSMQRLSSGLRINSAADDAAGLSISVGMNAQVKSMNQAVRNANDGVSLAQTAEGSLNETTNLLTRMRELAEESATGTVSDPQRSSIQNEFTQLASEIDRIANATQFNGANLLDGTLSVGISFQIGTNNTANDAIGLTIGAAGASALGLGATVVSSMAEARSALGMIDAALSSVSTVRGTLGAVQNRLQSSISNIQVAVENVSAAMSRIRDVDVAAETANMTRANILVQAGVSILSQANQSPQAALKLLQ